MPSAETTTVSPGSISRTKVAPMASRAQLSLAKTTSPSRSPMHRGRKPWGSRAAMSFCGLMITSEYAPSMRSMARSTACSMLSHLSRSCVMI